MQIAGAPPTEKSTELATIIEALREKVAISRRCAVEINWKINQIAPLKKRSAEAEIRDIIASLRDNNIGLYDIQRHLPTII
jgi:hypothetical protein